MGISVRNIARHILLVEHPGPHTRQHPPVVYTLFLQSCTADNDADAGLAADSDADAAAPGADAESDAEAGPDADAEYDGGTEHKRDGYVTIFPFPSLQASLHFSSHQSHGFSRASMHSIPFGFGDEPAEFTFILKSKTRWRQD